jgi:hypothetical protein
MPKLDMRTDSAPLEDGKTSLSMHKKETVGAAFEDGTRCMSTRESRTVGATSEGGAQATRGVINKVRRVLMRIVRVAGRKR